MKLKWVTVIATVLISLLMNALEGNGNGHRHSADAKGKRWAILVAGSKGYENYRHQADVCHAYQLLRKGGLKEENIIVFMYDDIAFNPKNPRPNIIINKPHGPNVYKGVPKDYTGDASNSKNLFGVISGNRSAVSGGSGKVLKSGPNDIIFIYYSDHGGAGLIGMPVDGDHILANKLVDALKKKHAAKTYKKMVIYLEACEGGSMFEGLLPNDINIYASTASNASEDSFGIYCPGFYPFAPLEYTTCLGDTYSISWLEDSDKNNMREETLHQQYETVRRRTLYGNMDPGSHVMLYGDRKMNNDFLVTYIGASHAHINHQQNATNLRSSQPSSITQTRLVSQRDTHLLHLRNEMKKAPDGSEEKLKAQKELDVEIAQREYVDNVFHLIGDLLFGEGNRSSMMLHVRLVGQPLVDDWDCFKTLIKTYERHCGTLSSYGRKYLRALANMCNAGISKEQLVVALSQACPS
ncbi:hypothetical protein RJT34_08988 [Clitoria ternatea]|uniref:Asparaginyl endopeptidase 7 n=1 Tax=Clitoria ternatea TaxID=43366 RepID=A0A7G5F3G0_CLITE|nr:asparaginyl endopeptidase 7 [Clitoria ternatea]